MDERAKARNFAAAVGDLLSSINNAGFDLHRVGPPGPGRTWNDLFAELVTSEPLQQASGPLFRDAHYARAVEEAFKSLSNAVREKSGLSLDGSALMQRAFSQRNPILKLNEMQTQSENDEQVGYMGIYAGAMTGIRNPRAHESQLADTPESALEMIVLANHLMRKLDRAERAAE